MILELQHRPIEFTDYMPAGWCGSCEVCCQWPAPIVCELCTYGPTAELDMEWQTAVIGPEERATGVGELCIHGCSDDCPVCGVMNPVNWPCPFAERPAT